MNEEYLWDKSGEPDPEIQQLEQVLGTLRYEPKPFVFPEDVRPAQGTRQWPWLAIAAVLLIALFAAGLWLLATRQPEPELRAVAPQSTPSPEHSQTASIDKEQNEDTGTPESSRPEKNKLARDIRKPARAKTPQLSAREREEAVEVKQQLMVALKVASEKLSQAQRKTQGPSPNQIRNQHKVG